MFQLLRGKSWRGGRKYPIKRDEEGRSARQRAFALFDVGLMPADVAAQVGISARTARRYRADWKKRPRDYRVHYDLMKRWLRNPEARRLFAAEIAGHLDLPVRSVLKRLSQPWAAKQVLTGEWSKWVDEKKRRRRWERLQAAGIILDMCAEQRVSPSAVIAELKERRRAAQMAQGQQQNTTA